MASRRISSLLSPSLAASSLFAKGRICGVGRVVSSYNTAAAVESPITPSVKVNYTQLLINGSFVDSASGKTFPTYDPRTGDVIAHVAEGDHEDVDRAVSAARKAFDEGPWPKMTAYERSMVLLRFADLLDKHTEELAALETWDNGKPYEQAAKVELPMVSRVFRYYAGWADKIHGLTIPADGPHHVQVLHEPIGVAGQIIPWNFPLLMFAWKVGPALACGNTIVLKSAEQTPLSALYAAKLLHEAGLPPGVLNVVSGFGPTAGAALASHMQVDKLAFTGSTQTGKVVLELAAKSNLKPVTLELGGKSPFIVCKDADVDQAVELAHFALFFNQGQCCCAGSRTYVHENVYDEFVEKAKARALKRSVGDPFKAGIEQGPQIDSEQFQKILRYIRSGVESGAILETGGERVGSKGYYIQPTVFSNVKEDMLIAKDEIFGPVQSILKFKDIDEVIQRANNTSYGLAAGVFTHDIDTANTLTRVHDRALELFEQMRLSGTHPNMFTLSSALKACAGIGLKELGRQLHCNLIKLNVGSDPFVDVGLIDMYSKSDMMNDARMVFNLTPVKDLIAWNAVISAHSQNGEDMEAVSLFPLMYKEGVGFNQTTLSTVLKSIASLQVNNVCKQVHALSAKSGFESDHYVVNSLIDAYGKCALLDDAMRIFRECLTVDLVGFTSMITAYSQSGQGEEALKLYLEMLDRGIEPDPYVCSSLLNACANLSAYEQGKQVHVHILKYGFISDIFAGNSLVNMYAKCGSIDDAERVFSKIPERGIVSWSAMIGGLAQHGHGKEALRVFNQMLKDGVSPNQITLVSVLCACNHAGLVTEAKKYFRSMRELFGFEPMQEHYACMIDLLGRAGRLDEAMELVNTMPFQADGSVWGALLGAARIHKNVELGQRAAEMLFTLEPEKSGTHVLLTNIYASVSMWDNVAKMRRFMKDCNVKKEPGISWIEVKDKIYTFIARDRSHVRSEEIYAKLDELSERLNKAGYVPKVEFDLHDVERGEKEKLLYHHSEKIAVAFALIATPPGAPIRVKKNLRVCVDCHTAFKFICKIVSREIIVRDINRYHHFKDGSCSCGDYW